MLLTSYDLSNKNDNEKERNININLYNRKYNLLKLKNVYQNQINQIKIKIENLKTKNKEIKPKNYNNKNIIKLKNKINEITNENNDIIKSIESVENENETLEEFFKDFFEKNDKFNIDENGCKRKKNKINIGKDEQLIDIFGLEENDKILAYKKNKLFD